MHATPSLPPVPAKYLNCGPPLPTPCVGAKAYLLRSLHWSAPPSVGNIKREVKSFLQEAKKLTSPSIPKRRFTFTPHKRMKGYAFRRLQALWQSNRREAVTWILEGKEVNTGCPLPITNVEAHYELVWEAKDKYKGLNGFSDMPNANNMPFYYRITEAEVLATIKAMAPHTSPGPDRIRRLDLLKVDGKGSKLAKMFNGWLVSGRIPKTMKRSITTLLPKQVSAEKLKEVSAWRPISVSSTILRTFSGIMAKRMREACPPHPWQRGFVEEAGCSANVYTIDSLIKKSKSMGTPLAAMFIDLSKAFDTVPHGLILDSLRARKVDGLIIDLINSSLTDCFSSIKTRIGVTRQLKLNLGVKQGDPLSPILFNLSVDPLIYALERDGIGVEVSNGVTLSVIAYADDLLILSNSWDGMDFNLKILECFANTTGLRVNPDKCFGFMISKHKRRMCLNDCPPWKINCHPIHMAGMQEQIPYLGISINPWTGVVTPDMLKELKLLCSRVSRAKLRARQRIQLLKCYLVPRLLYRADLSGMKITALKELDRVIRVAVKQWLHLPLYICNGILYSSIKNGGLGIPKLTNLVPSTQIRRLIKFTASKDQMCKILMTLNNWDTKILKLWQQVTGLKVDGPIDSLDLSFVTGKALKDIEFRKWAKSKTQGAGIENFWNDRVSNHWLREPPGSGLSDSRFIRGLQLRSNTVPTKCVLYRGRPEQDTTCSMCRKAPESLLHLLAICPALQANRMVTHNKICKFLTNVAESEDWSVRQEPHFKCNGKTGVPDIVMFRNGIIHVVDVTIPYESTLDTLLNAAKAKVLKYKPFKEVIMNSIPGSSSIKFWGLAVGARGKWPTKNFKLLQKIGLPVYRQKSIAETISSMALNGSIGLVKLFLANK